MRASRILKCRWTGCFEVFTDILALGQHVLDAHGTSEVSYCLWEFCHQHNYALSDKAPEASRSHLLSHSVFEAYSFNSTMALIDRGLHHLPHPIICNQKCPSGKYSDCLVLKSSPEYEADCDLPIAIKSELDPTPFVPNYFGCYGCHSVFKLESELLLHLLPTLYDLLPEIQSDTCGFKCRWLGCTATFETSGRLQCHVESQHVTINASPFCFWRYCSGDSTKLFTVDRWRRHMLLHSFIETCVGRTKARLSSCRRRWTLECRGVQNLKPFYVNRSTDKLFWLEDILAHDFQCRWVDCDFSTSSAHLYTEHVVDHATTDVGSKQLHVCCWIVSLARGSDSVTQRCGRTVRDATILKEHLYRHTGLPRFVCNKCYVGFTEFDTYKEHFMWSLTDREKPCLSRSGAKVALTRDRNAINPTLNDPSQSCAPAPTTQESSGPLVAFEHCVYCTKPFLTKHRLWAHQKALNCVPPQKRTALRAQLNLSDNSRRTTSLKRKSICTQVPRIIHLPDMTTEKTSQLYCCQVEDCQFQSGLYAAYIRHFKRFHHPDNPDGVWYECHVCHGFRVRKVQTISHHLKRVHHFRPPGDRQRFSYTCTQNDGIYRLAGLPSAPTISRGLKKILPRVTS